MKTKKTCQQTPFLNFCLPVSVCLSVCLLISVCLFVCRSRSVCLSDYLSVCIDCFLPIYTKRLFFSLYTLHYLFSSRPFPSLVLSCHVVRCCGVMVVMSRHLFPFIVPSFPLSSFIICQSVFICLLYLPVTHTSGRVASCLSVFLCLIVCLSTYLSVCLSVCLCQSVYLCLSFSVSVSLSVCLSVCLCLFVCLSACLAIYYVYLFLTAFLVNNLIFSSE